MNNSQVGLQLLS